MFFLKCKIIISVIALIFFLTAMQAIAQENGSSTKPKLTNEELTQLLAPVALYPDPLLSQMLIAATYPFEVIEAQRWLEKNSALQGATLDNALQERNWDVSILSICHYPQVLSMMSDNLDWTAKIGDAFSTQQQDVMDTIQELRAKARVQDNLKDTGEQTVTTEGNNIVIQPATPEVIYVPVYDPYRVYGTWWYPDYPPFPIFYPGISYINNGIIFSPGFFIGVGVIGWCNFNWRAHNVVIVDIGRTARFNRHSAIYKGPTRFDWHVDRDRRLERVLRAHEIPVLRSPVRPSAITPGIRQGGAGTIPGKIDLHRESVVPGRVDPGRLTPDRIVPGRIEPGIITPRSTEPKHIEPRIVPPRPAEPLRLEPGRMQPERPAPGREVQPRIEIHERGEGDRGHETIREGGEIRDGRGAGGREQGSGRPGH